MRTCKRKKSGKENRTPRTTKRTLTTRHVKKKSAVMIERRSPDEVNVSSDQVSAFTRRLLDLEARLGLLEAHFSEKTPVMTVEQSTSTDSPVDVPCLDAENDCKPPREMWSCLQPPLQDHSPDADFCVPFEASTPLPACTPPMDVLPVCSASVGLTSDPMETTLMIDSEKSPFRDSPFSSPPNTPRNDSVMASFTLRLPETPRNTHPTVRRSPVQGVILPDARLNHVSKDTESKLYLDSAGPLGKPKADRFVALLFKRLIPLNLYQSWVGCVNFDGSRGKNALPSNLRRAISDAVDRQFLPEDRDWKRIKNRLNELLRNKRTSFPLF